MIGKAGRAVALLERFLGCTFLKYHCIIHQESLCGKVWHLQHVMVPVVKCVNKIRARGCNGSVGDWFNSLSFDSFERLSIYIKTVNKIVNYKKRVKLQEKDNNYTTCFK